MPQGDKTKSDEFPMQKNLKVAKDKICSGTVSKNKCHQEYCMHRNFHNFIKYIKWLFFALIHSTITEYRN